MGQGSAIDADVAEQIGDRIDGELDIAIEGQVKGGQGGSRCHAFVYCDGSNRGGNGGKFPARPGGIGIEIKGGGVECEITGGCDAAGSADIEGCAGGEVEVGGTGELARNRHCPWEGEGGGCGSGAGLEIKETLESEAARGGQCEG